MKMHKRFAMLALASCALAAPAFGVAVYPTNDGFELPDKGSGAGAYEYGVGTGFTQVGGAGVAANGSAFNVTGATNGNSDGTTSTAGQAAFLQGGNGNLDGAGATSVSQAVTLPAGTATLSYSQEARLGGGVTLVVYLDGVAVPSGTSFPLSESSFDTVTRSLGVVTAGSHIIGFAGNNLAGGDKTSFVDNIRIDVVPEPASLALLGFGLLFGRRRMRS